jgi:opacity protein-like surface antigen
MKALALAAAVLLSSASWAEEEKPGESWELDLFAGYGQLGYPGLDTTNQNWLSGGPGFAVSVAYRGPHFTHPFFDIAYVPIVSSNKSVFIPGSTGGSESVNNSTWAWGFVLGPGWDVDWFRLRAGVGLYDLYVRTKVLDHESTVSGLKLGFLVTASAMVWRPEPFAVGIEARLTALQAPTAGIYQTSWELGVTGRWDFVHNR